MKIVRHENVWWWGRSWTFITEDGKGMIELAVLSEEGSDYFGEIRSLMVHESARGKGLGGELLFMCEQYARQLGLEQVTLNCRKGSWLVDWYKRRGFKVWDESCEYSKGQTVAMQKIFENMPPSVER